MASGVSGLRRPVSLSQRCEKGSHGVGRGQALEVLWREVQIGYTWHFRPKVLRRFR